MVLGTPIFKQRAAGDLYRGNERFIMVMSCAQSLAAFMRATANARCSRSFGSRFVCVMQHNYFETVEGTEGAE